MQSAHVKQAVLCIKDCALSPVDFIRMTEILLKSRFLKQTRMRAKQLTAQVNYSVLFKFLVLCLLI